MDKRSEKVGAPRAQAPKAPYASPRLERLGAFRVTIAASCPIGIVCVPVNTNGAWSPINPDDLF